MPAAMAGPHGAHLELVDDAANPDNRIYRVASAGGHAVNLTGLELRKLQDAREELDEALDDGEA